MLNVSFSPNTYTAQAKKKNCSNYCSINRDNSQRNRAKKGSKQKLREQKESLKKLFIIRIPTSVYYIAL